MKQLSAKGFQHPRRVEDAKRIILAAVRESKISKVDSVRLQKAVGRILAQAVIARRHLPASDLAIVDGYAVRSVELRQASPRNPVVLQLAGESKLGEVCRVRVRPGQTVAVATGSKMPKGADAVAMVEETRRSGGNQIQFRMSVRPWHGVTRRGEDIMPGKQLLPKGLRLRPEDVGAMKALGVTRVHVVGRIRVGVLSTGNELVNSFQRSNRAKIVDLNRPILSAMLRELGAEPVDLGIARDNERDIKEALKAGLKTTNMVLVTAGSSVGKRDMVPNCIDSLGKPGMLVHGVAMRPALPTGLAVVRGKPIISLPGFPVSAMVAFRTFVRPLLAKLAGVSDLPEPTVRAILKEKITGIPGFRTYVRVKVRRVKDRYLAVPLKGQRASLLSSMVNANGVVTVPESVTMIKAGTEVSVALTGAPYL